jgi:hypothetical protein
LVLFCTALSSAATTGCGSSSDQGSDPLGTPVHNSNASDGGEIATEPKEAGTSRDGAMADADNEDAAASLPSVPALVSVGQVCKLLNNLNTSDPTPNQVQYRANILGADLGIPVDSGGTLFFFFGDTVGFAGIWNGPSHPDAVGYATDPTSAVVADPSKLCQGLAMLTLPPAQSIGPTVDSRVQADFAAGSMAPPQRHSLSEYIHNPAGGSGKTFPNLPGDFEVPSGAFANGGSIYLFYTTVVSPAQDFPMKGSYLARWSAPAANASPDYDILYTVDERFNGAGALGGDFINIAAAPADLYVYMFGTGEFRASPVHLARKRLDQLSTAGGFERFDATSRTWAPAGTAASAPVITVAGYGETSVRSFESIHRWVFLAQELVGHKNRIVARWANRPDGPWSAPTVVLDMADPAFLSSSCCVPDDHCEGTQFLDCDLTGFYGAYLFPDVQAHVDGSFTIIFTVSSFNPYNVALFTATFR